MRPVHGKPDQYLLFDNGNHRKPYFSRAIEYKLDTNTGTAEKVWEFRHQPDRYSSQYGSAQRLSGGNTLINWSSWPPLHATEVDAGGKTVLSLRSGDFSSERVHRFNWSGKADRPYLLAESSESGINLIFHQFGSQNILRFNIYGDTLPAPDQLLGQTSSNTMFFSDLKSLKNWYFRITSENQFGQESDFSNEERVFVKIVEAGKNKVLNGDFSQGISYWTLSTSEQASAQVKVSADGLCSVSINQPGTSTNQIRLEQKNIELINGKRYLLEFEAKADSLRLMDVRLHGPFSSSDYSQTGLVRLNTTVKHYSFEFEMKRASDSNVSLAFLLGEESPGVHFDNILLKSIDPARLQKSQQKAEAFKLFQNYPNPFNPSTSIRFSLPFDSHVRLTVFDLKGRRLKTLIDERKKPGTHAVMFEAEEYASGLYLYRLETEHYSATRKLTVLK